MRGPQGAGARGGVGDEGGQLGTVGDGERDIGAAATAGRAALRLHGKVTIGEQSDVERGQGERLTPARVRPPQCLGDAHVDRQGRDFHRLMAVHDTHAARTDTDTDTDTGAAEPGASRSNSPAGQGPGRRCAATSPTCCRTSLHRPYASAGIEHCPRTLAHAAHR